MRFLGVFAVVVVWRIVLRAVEGLGFWAWGVQD